MNASVNENAYDKLERNFEGHDVFSRKQKNLFKAIKLFYFNLIHDGSETFLVLGSSSAHLVSFYEGKSLKY